MSKVANFYMYEWRTHTGATQQDLADAMGLQKGYVSELERGLKRYNQDHLEAMAKFFGCAASDILTKNPLAPQTAAVIVDIWDRIPERSRDEAQRMLKSLAGDD